MVQEGTSGGETVFWCTTCGFKLRGDEKYCPGCGCYMIKEGHKIKCKRCGAELTGNFCAKCGTPALVNEKDVRGGNLIENSAKTLADGVVRLLDYFLKAIGGIFR